MRAITCNFSVLPVIALGLSMLPATGVSWEAAPNEALHRAWIEVQIREQRPAQENWWRSVEPETLQEFLCAGVDVNIADRRSWTPLHSAARYSTDPQVLAMLLDAGARVDARDRAGDTPLHWAAANNPNVAIVESLIAAGSDVNAVDRFGWLPIHTAAESSSEPEVIRALLAAGSKRGRRAYFLLFSPAFLLKHNDKMSDADRERAMALLKSRARDVD